jgi:ubiquinone/menaquinone biosynthesis C-methylase UbiE
MFSSPEENLKQWSIGHSMVVADLGAGTGFYTIPVAKIVSQGKVYAIEVLPELVATLRSKIKDAHLSNVEVLVGDVETLGGTKLGENTVDRVIASNMLFQVEHKDRFVSEVKRILAPGGEVLLIDWQEGGLMGPRKEFVVSMEKAKELFASQGFAFKQDVEAGDYHYGMIFIKK